MTSLSLIVFLPLGKEKQMVSLQPGRGKTPASAPGKPGLFWCGTGVFKRAQARRSLHSFREGSSPTQEVGASGRALPALLQALPGMQIENIYCCCFRQELTLELRADFHSQRHQLSIRQLWGTTPAPLQLQPCTHAPIPRLTASLRGAHGRGRLYRRFNMQYPYFPHK